MPDFAAGSVHELLTAIADGKRWDDVRAAWPQLTQDEFRHRSQFVQDCQAGHLNAWKSW
jgi:hypothetical protein